jgi:hypothetical protein
MGKARRLQLWSGDQGTLTLAIQGGGSYDMKYQRSPCDGCNSHVATKTGYGAVVITGFTYSLNFNWDFRPSANHPPVTMEFSDVQFGTRFGQSDLVQLSVNSQPCSASSQHSRAFLGLDGPKAEGLGVCRSGDPIVTASPTTSTKTPTATASPTVMVSPTATKTPTTRAPTVPTNSPLPLPDRVLVWNDEFDGTEIDENKWEHEVWNPYHVNNELQFYTARAENSFVSGGVLTIRAQMEASYGGRTNTFSSARLRTKNRGDWKFGRLEIRAKLPTGQGMWPAIWMLPTDWKFGGWPDSYVFCLVMGLVWDR